METDKHAGGRPTLYSSQVLNDTRDYLQNSNDQMVGDRIKVNLPTIEGLALYLDVTRSTVYLWQKEHPEFSDMLDILLQKQGQALINNGLSGNYNPTIAKLLLHKHGYTDKQEVDQKTEHSGSIDHNINYSKLSDAALREIASLDNPQEGKD